MTENDVTGQSESRTFLFYLQFLVYDKYVTLHLELKGFREVSFIIMLTPNNDEHLPLLFPSVELDVFGCRVVTVRKKTRTIVSARETEVI